MTRGRRRTRFVPRSWWIVAVVAIVMVASAVYVGRLRLSTIEDRAIGHSEPVPRLGKPRGKVIDYSVTGPAGARVAVSYLVPGDGTADEQVTLPWRKRIRSADFTVAAGLVAQSRSAGVQCAVRVNGVRQAADRAPAAGAVASCPVPVA